MKDFIKQKLQEAIKQLPYDPKPELKAATGYSSLSNPTHKVDLKQIQFKIAKAAQIAADFRKEHPDDHYFSIPTSGDGFYQVEIRHDGQIKTKHVRASGDMEQRNGAFQPSDLGTCKSFQNVAKYCFVAAGKHHKSVGASPAEDAANKALIIFRNEILDFFTDSSYVDDKAADISKEKMSDKQAQHKQKKDLEAKVGRRISDSEWNTFLQTGQEPKGKNTLSRDADKINDFEKRQAELRAKIAARQNSTKP